MADNFTVALSEIISGCSLEVAYTPADTETILVKETDVNRPGIELTGFYDYFNPERIQIIGRTEYAYLSLMSDKERYQTLEKFFEKKVRAVIVTRDLDVFDEMHELAEKYETPILISKDSTSSFMSTLIAFLNLNLAPRIQRHGVLVEIYGEGVFIQGESGVGKSETAL